MPHSYACIYRYTSSQILQMLWKSILKLKSISVRCVHEYNLVIRAYIHIYHGNDSTLEIRDLDLGIVN